MKFLDRFLAAICILLLVASCLALVSSSATSQTERDYLILINEDNPYIFGGEYDTALQNDLVYLPDAYGEATPLEKEAAKAFQKLQSALYEKGMTIALYSGYMTKENQEYAYNYYSNLPGWSENNKARLPGFSEHHTGLLLNVVIWYGEGEGAIPTWYTETSERQESIPYFRLLHEALADYGFIDRYPRGKEDITGLPCEPYEIRYVGSPLIAHEIMDKGLCLEEYLEKHPKK